VTAKTIIFPFPLSDTIMQAIDERLQKTSITVSAYIKERVCSKKRGNQTYDDVLEQMLNVLDVGEEGKVNGVVFLYEVPVRDEMRKLKYPVQLLLHVDKNGKCNLANTEFKILVSFCDTLEEALEEAGFQFADNLEEFTNPDLPLTAEAKEFGKKLQNMVWM
jgi:Ca2+-binding EF-hand superfamily protein